MKAILMIKIGVLLNLYAFGAGINFYKGSYESLFEKAKKENKLVMLYFHFDGCGACKEMEKNVFPEDEVGVYYNDHFINFEINTLKGEGIEINKIYNVTMHPTFMYLDTDRNIVHKYVGSDTKEEFIKQAECAIHPENSLSEFKNKYKEGKRDPDFLYDYCFIMKAAFELDSALINEYLATQTDEQLKEERNIRFIYEFAMHLNKVCLSSSSRYYHFMDQNRELFNKYFDPEQVETRLFFMLSNDVYKTALLGDESLFLNELKKLEPFENGKQYLFKQMDGGITFWTWGKLHILPAKLYFYEYTKDTVKFNITADEYVLNIWEDSEALNDYAWSSYEKYEDSIRIKRALKCSERSVELNEKYINLDTWAWLLYKSGDFKNALSKAEKAIELAKANNEDYSETANLVEMIKSKK